MRTKIGKGGVFAALTAVLLVTTVLITSCSGPSGGGSDGTGYPPGKGAVKISINDGKGRSITDIPSFTSYDLSFQKYTTAAGTVIDGAAESYNAVTNLSAAIYLDPGFYKLTVIGKTGVAVDTAEGTSGVFEITAGADTQVMVPVGPYITGGGTGTFSYNIAVSGPPAATAATLAITSIAPTPTYAGTYATPQSIFANLGSAATVGALPAGYYYVDIGVTVTGGATTAIKQVLHIYNGVTSSFTYTFVSGQFVSVTRGYVDGITVEADLQPELEDSASDPVTDGDTVTVDLNTAAAVSPTNPPTTTITVTNDDEFASYTWYYNGASIGTPSAPLVITAGAAPFAAPGTPGDPAKIYHITVIGITHGGIPYDTYFLVEVIDTP